MKKILALLILLLMSNTAFSLPVNYILGSFRSSRAMDRIYFLPTYNHAFSPKESYIADRWLKQRFIGSKYNYSDLTIGLEFIGQVRQTVKGCFYSWFKNIDINTRFHLMEHLKPNGFFSFNTNEVKFLSDSLNKYTIDNSKICKDDNILGDITTTYITIGLEQYLSDKSNNRFSNVKYDSIVEKSYNQQYKNYGNAELKKFQNWIDLTQNNFPAVSSEIVSEYINIIERLNLQNVSESDSFFIFMEALSKKNPNIKDYLDDSFIKSSELLYAKCFYNGDFLRDICSSDNIGNNFVIIKLTRKSKFLNNLVWIEK